MKRTLLTPILASLIIHFPGVFSQQTQAASVTIVTHGLDPNGQIFGIPNWENSMADAIAARIDPAGNGSSVSQYQLQKTALSSPTLTKVKGPNPGTSGNQMDIIIMVDWTSVSSFLSPGTSDEVGAEIAGTLLNPPTDGTYSRSFVELPLHFIGHSRGTYVNSAAIKELGRKGIWVDHCTILDGQAYGTDGDLAVWSNIKFADNYYQTLAFDDLLDGFPVSGSLGFDLSSLSGFAGVHPIHDVHARVHTYYHGTINLTASSDGDYEIQRNDCWYPLCVGSGVQPIRGFYFSRFLPNEYTKADYLAGLGQHFGGYAAYQTIISPDGSLQWANVVLQNRDNQWTVQSGTRVRIYYPYWDTDSSCTITFAPDDDQNPYNNSPGNEVGSVSVSRTQGGFWPNSGVFNWFPSLSHNNRYLYAKITETSSPFRSRYYYLAQKFTVTAAPPPPPPLPPNQGNDLTRSALLVWDDHDGDKDGVPEASETVGLKIRLRNNSASILRNVSGTLSSTFGNVQISDSLTLYNDLNPSQASYGSGDYDMFFNFASTTSVPFHLRATYMKDNVEYYQDWDFSTTIYENGALEPTFVVDHVVWDDGPPKGDGDGVVESGEKPEFWIWLKNIGNATATEVRATVSDVAVLKVRDETPDYPNLVAGGSAQGHTDGFDLDDRIPQNFAGLLTADVVVTYGGNSLQKVIFDYPLFDIKPAAWIRVSPERYDFGVSPTTTNVMISWTIRNSGATNMTVTAITSTNADTIWSGDALPWNVAAGDSKTITVTITTSNLQGPITRSLVVTTDARIYDVGEEDRIIITGIVGDSVSISQIPNITGASHPDISGDWIVWSDGRNGNADIYAYSLATGQERPICTNDASQYSPFIWGNLVVWQDKRNAPTNDYYDIYAYDLGRPDLNDFPVLLSSGHASLIGVDSNLVAVADDYFIFTERSSWDSARNLVVYEYLGNGQFTQRFNSGFTGNASHNPMQSIERGGDFTKGLLVVKRHEIWWNTVPVNDQWESRNQRLQTINFAAGQSSLNDAGNNWHRLSCAERDRFVYQEDDANGDQQIYMRRTSGVVQQLTSTPNLDYATDALGLGGADGSDCVVYDYGDLSRPGLYYLDRSNGQEYIISTSVGPSNLRMDDLRVAFEDDNASGAIKYVFLKQADVSIAPANIIFDNESPMEGTTVNVSVIVQNLSAIGTTNSLTVRLYDGDPDFGGVQLGSDRVISGGLSGGSSATVMFDAVPIGVAGTHNIFARASAVIGENPANNKASRALTVVGLPQNVSFDVIDGFGFETGLKTAVIAVQRSGSTNILLTVNYSLTGTASNGVDYASLSGSLSILAGSVSATLLVTPVEDALAENDETVIVTLATNAAYTVGSPSSATGVIADNDRTPQKPRFGNLSSSTTGGFQFSLTGDRGRIYVLDTSSNLVHWTPLVTNITPNDIFSLIDPSATDGSQRFYRARHP